MRVKLTLLGVEIFEWVIGKEEDFSALLPAIVGQLVNDNIVRSVGNTECSFEIEPEILEDYDDDDYDEPEMNLPNKFGFNR